jgi:hypothetical protein
MQHYYCFEAVHCLMCDLQSDDNHLFSSIPIVMGGDFTQTLLVIQQDNHSTIVTASLQQSVI